MARSNQEPSPFFRPSSDEVEVDPLVPWGREAVSRRLSFRSCLLGGLVLASMGCGEPPLRPAPPEHIVVVAGMPTVRVEPDWLDKDGAPGDPTIRQSRPRICETFSERRNPGAADVLVVFDAGRSMTSWKEALREGLQGFMSNLLAGGSLDLQVGILAAAPGAGEGGFGRLVPIPGAAEPFISCTPGGPCNVNEPITAFFQALGQVESAPSSLGLLAIMDALGPRGEATERFLRDDTALHIVLISEADDVSCAPRVQGDGKACHSFEACRCADQLAWGDTDWFVRFLQGRKGHGFGERVRFSALVAKSSDSLRGGDDLGPFAGCSLDRREICATPWQEGVACGLAAPRYAAVARATGGALMDICTETSHLAGLGASISGTAMNFPLERKPLSGTIETVLLSNPNKSCNHHEPCPDSGFDCIRGKCGQVVSEGGTDGWRYVSCSSGIFRNMVQFEGGLGPLQRGTLQVCYDVEVGADLPLCP